MSLWKVMTRPMSQAAQVAGAQEAAQAGKFVWGAEGFKWIGDTKGGAAPGAGAGAGQGGQQPQYSVASQASQQQPARSPAT